MAKPICVIYFPENYSDMTGQRSWIYDYMRVLNGEETYDNKFKPTENFKDYYWFCFYKDEITEPEFKVFYEKDFTQIQYEELKQLITTSIENSKPTTPTI